ncbi:hypothetical protein TVAG_207540 [Trichomonas vaginalis G3]|uniref:Initiator binding domain-containing protein n=1 Tax=Trichomonas vaginalis (strain ATCC PRA-98 / G3) TaxID=412133 RepID=A2F2L7_TRIV3|nr:transcription-initiator DNA-binding domain ibd family [Trichomonas vaginalis G3]EAY00851.1 hypothetical protein TVAG_207540 [Trichomonas vaginalis G3]KAI5544609.1 transcription-initiator DNA-binding domain ibd family [Trichomonas vaginalis G3]|eukprot:XP_001313780.1 hypothetical protein [Trichomonas vaginalis G3]
MEDEQQLAKVITEMPNFVQEYTLMQSMKQYFAALRHTRGHNPEGSPIDLEVLLLLKLILGSVDNPIQTLHSVGIIIIGDEIAINANYLKTFLSTCRSRINNSMKHLGWELSNHDKTTKSELLQPLVDRKDSRNWTIRIIPPTSAVYTFIHENPSVRLRMTTNQPQELSLGQIILEPGQGDDNSDQYKKDASSPNMYGMKMN